MFTPFFWKIAILNNIFQMGWNHQLADNLKKVQEFCQLIRSMTSRRFKFRRLWLNVLDGWFMGDESGMNTSEIFHTQPWISPHIIFMAAVNQHNVHPREIMV